MSYIKLEERAPKKIAPQQTTSKSAYLKPWHWVKGKKNLLKVPRHKPALMCALLPEFHYLGGLEKLQAENLA